MSVVSVIIPVYKVEKYLERCIESVLNQTYSNFELVLVDDGSPDKCGIICDEFAERDRRIKVIHQKNAGVSAARNTGIEWVLENSDSEWISFIDSDDWVHPRYLEFLYDAVNNTNIKVAICEYVKTNEDKMVFDENKFENKVLTPEDLFRKQRVLATVAWGKFYHKSLFAEIRYPVGKTREDEFVTWKVLFSREQLVKICNPLYIYYQREDSIMHQRWSKIHLDTREAFEEQLIFFKNNGYRKAYLHTVGPYINFMTQAIENLNRYYPHDEQIAVIRTRLKELYVEQKDIVRFSLLERIHINSMLLPINANIVPWLIKKRKVIIKIYVEKGINGLLKRAYKKIF